MTKDRPIRLADLKAGDVIVATAEARGVDQGSYVVAADSEGDLYIENGKGMRYLAELADRAFILTGFRRAAHQ